MAQCSDHTARDKSWMLLVEEGRGSAVGTRKHLVDSDGVHAAARPKLFEMARSRLGWLSYMGRYRFQTW